MKSIIRKIILATDFSESSEEASYHAVSLAQTFNAELQALHVFTPRPIGTDYKSVQKVKQAKEDFVLTRERGEKMLNKLAKSFDVTANTIFAEGHAGPEIIRIAAEQSAGVMFWGGVSLLLVGFLFKVSAAPFHMWTPDVYQGAPTTITGFMSTASKAAAFAALVVVLWKALPAERWADVLAVFAVITMVIGNVIALSQQNIKRMLAYSSIAHAGYVLVGLASGSQAGYSGALFYLMVYTIMNIGAFGVLALLEWDGKEGSEQTLESLAGVGYRKPFLGWTMAVFMFSLSGFPPLAGFLGKWAVFAPAIDADLVWLAIIGVLTSAVSAYYYLRVLVVFFMKPEGENSPMAEHSFDIPRSSAAVLIACVVLLVVFGVTTFALDVTSGFFAADTVTQFLG